MGKIGPNTEKHKFWPKSVWPVGLAKVGLAKVGHNLNFTWCAGASCFCCDVSFTFAYDVRGVFFPAEDTPIVATFTLSPIKDWLQQ